MKQYLVHMNWLLNTFLYYYNNEIDTVLLDIYFLKLDIQMRWVCLRIKQKFWYQNNILHIFSESYSRDLHKKWCTGHVLVSYVQISWGKFTNIGNMREIMFFDVKIGKLPFISTRFISQIMKTFTGQEFFMRNSFDT